MCLWPSSWRGSVPKWRSSADVAERLWAGWRIPAMADDDEAVLADAGSGLTLFEAILASGLADSVTHIVWRGAKVFTLLNRYPYSNGHVLVVPYRPLARLEDLDHDERRELWDTVHDAVAAVQAAFEPDGVNIGVNLGDGAGPSVADHLHVHVVPRWQTDTNFMSAIADVRVLPQTLLDSWERLIEAWPHR